VEVILVNAPLGKHTFRYRFKEPGVGGAFDVTMVVTVEK
jgi:hypothetical protein